MYGFQSKKALDTFSENPLQYMSVNGKMKVMPVGALYKTLRGDEYVTVTAVYDTPDAPKYRWPDKVCVGRVTNCVRSIDTREEALHYWNPRYSDDWNNRSRDDPQSSDFVVKEIK